MEKEQEVRYIGIRQINAVLRSIVNGRFFHLVFKRTAPKCAKCGTKYRSWDVFDCPKCGGMVSHFADVVAQTGVHNPSNKEIAPKGNGMSFEEKRKRGIFGYYDVLKKAYRECHIGSIVQIVTDGIIYNVTKD